jgi:hypothetical protein
MSPSESVGELATEDEVLDASDMMDSSLIFVCNGRSTLAGSKSPWSAASGPPRCDSAFVTIDPVDLENGDASNKVTPMRDDGESKDCERIRTLGDGVRGGAIVVAIKSLYDETKTV